MPNRPALLSRPLLGEEAYSFYQPIAYKDYSLRAYTPIKIGAKPLGNLSTKAVGWSREKTFTGGDWRASFILYGDTEKLETWFYDRLGAHIEEHSEGGKTWQGFVWEMDLVTPGGFRAGDKRWRRRRRSYENLFNRVRCDYINPDDGTTGSTSWYSDSDSITRYGQKEEIIHRNMGSTNAAEAAQEFLELYASGPPQLISFEKPAERPFLEVTVAGYVAVANFRFTATADDSSSTVSGWIADIMATDLDSDMLRTGTIASNTRALNQSLSIPTRAWELLETLLTLRDVSGNRFNITTRRHTLYYEQWTNEPIGIIRNGEFYSPSGLSLEQAPRVVKPGIYRDADFMGIAKTRHLTNINTFFQSPADFLLETIEVDKDGLLVPRLGVYEEEEAYRTFYVKED